MIFSHLCDYMERDLCISEPHGTLRQDVGKLLGEEFEVVTKKHSSVNIISIHHSNYWSVRFETGSEFIPSSPHFGDKKSRMKKVGREREGERESTL